VKIAIVNDSVMATEVLRRIVVSVPDYQVAWCAKNGAEAIMHCNHLVPDLILMDLIMPVMDGVEATRRIMETRPCPILVVTATVSGRSSAVFKAMGAGALDVVATPVVGANPQNEMGHDLLKKISLIHKLKGGVSPGHNPNAVNNGIKPSVVNDNCLIALGCSTGGPQAIFEILSSFPQNINAAIVIIQHMDKKFTAGLVAWLNKQLSLPIRLIAEGDRLKKGVVMLPHTNSHLIIKRDLSMGYSAEPHDNFYHPSIDVFFKSTALNWHGPIVAALLTGMGRDGAFGLQALNKRGCKTICQDQESSVVFGMPKAAIELKAADEILPLKDIGPRILKMLPS